MLNNISHLNHSYNNYYNSNPKKQKQSFSARFAVAASEKQFVEAITKLDQRNLLEKVRITPFFDTRVNIPEAVSREMPKDLKGTPVKTRQTIRIFSTTLHDHNAVQRAVAKIEEDPTDEKAAKRLFPLNKRTRQYLTPVKDLLRLIMNEFNIDR